MKLLEWSDLVARHSAAQRTFVQELRERGYVGLRLGAEFCTLRATLFESARKFFWQRDVYKNQFRTASSQGYLTPDPGLHEVFEVKKHRTDPRLRVPEPVRDAWMNAYDALEAVAVGALGVLSIEVTGSETLLSLLDDSTFRLLHFDRIHVGPPEIIQRALQDHTDSGLLTVAPKATANALEVLERSDLTWTPVEEGLEEGDVLVFAGETLSRVCNNYFPSLLHRPAARRMSVGAQARLSAPFFLRARPDAVLDVAVCDPSKLGTVDPFVRAPVTVEALSDNLGGARDALPWKKTAYYRTFAYAEAPEPSAPR
jgi:isopenicillin N synthase-like dioxygenase